MLTYALTGNIPTPIEGHAAHDRTGTNAAHPKFMFNFATERLLLTEIT